MDDIFEEIGKGIARAIGFIIMDILYNFVCYYIGWPIMKTITFGKFPEKVNYDYLHSYNRQGALCSFLGLVVGVAAIIIVTN